jgi:hypothetical protein
MLVKELWDEYHKLLGMPDLFGQPTGVQSSGRSLAVQIEAAITAWTASAARSTGDCAS